MRSNIYASAKIVYNVPRRTHRVSEGRYTRVRAQLVAARLQPDLHDTLPRRSRALPAPHGSRTGTHAQRTRSRPPLAPPRTRVRRPPAGPASRTARTDCCGPARTWGPAPPRARRASAPRRGPLRRPDLRIAWWQASRRRGKSARPGPTWRRGLPRQPSGTRTRPAEPPVPGLRQLQRRRQ